MKKELKNQIIESLSAQLKENPNFYLTDISGLNAEQTSKLRRECFNEEIKLTVVKNTLLGQAIKAMANQELDLLQEALSGNTAIMFCASPNAPAKLIKKWQKEGSEKPALKGAYVQECAFVGADKLGELVAIKSKEELIAEVVSLLQSPARNVISALESQGGKIAGIVKTLEEKKSE